MPGLGGLAGYSLYLFIPRRAFDTLFRLRKCQQSIFANCVAAVRTNSELARVDSAKRGGNLIKFLTCLIAEGIDYFAIFQLSRTFFGIHLEWTTVILIDSQQALSQFAWKNAK